MKQKKRRSYQPPEPEFCQRCNKQLSIDRTQSKVVKYCKPCVRDVEREKGRLAYHKRKLKIPKPTTRCQLCKKEYVYSVKVGGNTHFVCGECAKEFVERMLRLDMNCLLCGKKIQKKHPMGSGMQKYCSTSHAKQSWLIMRRHKLGLV